MFKRLMMGLLAASLLVAWVVPEAEAIRRRARASVINDHTCSQYLPSPPAPSGTPDKCYGATSVTDRLFGAEIVTTEGDCAYFEASDGTCYMPTCEIEGTLVCETLGTCGTRDETLVDLNQLSFIVSSNFNAEDFTATGVAILHPAVGTQRCTDLGEGLYYDYLPDAIVAWSNYTGSFTNIPGNPGTYELIEVCPGFTGAIFDCELWWDSSPDFAGVERPKLPCCGETNSITVQIPGGGGAVTSDIGGLSHRLLCSDFQ
jgi:hypothetical protein